MGRSSKEEASRTRARIVETASELFRASGVDQVSVADLMGALGMTTGGFYKHFASKEALVAEAFGLAFEQSESAWREVTQHESKGPPIQRAGLVEYYLRPNPQRRCPMIAFAGHAARSDAGEVSRDIYQQGTEALLQCFVDPMSNRIAGGSPSPTERNAMLLFAAMIGTRVLKEATGDVEWVNELRDVVLDAATVAA